MATSARCSICYLLTRSYIPDAANHVLLRINKSASGTPSVNLPREKLRSMERRVGEGAATRYNSARKRLMGRGQDHDLRLIDAGLYIGPRCTQRDRNRVRVRGVVWNVPRQTA